MQEKTILRTIQIGILLMALASNNAIICHDIPAYMPADVRAFISNTYKTAEYNLQHLAELNSMIQEDRVIASRNLVRKAIDEAAKLTTNRSAKNHLQAYRDSLREKWLLLSMEGADRTQFMLDSVARSVDSTALDIMRLSTELTERDAVAFCGDCKEKSKRQVMWCEKRFADKERSVRPSNPTDPSVIFNPNMMTNIDSNTPTVIFATGINSPMINAWPMQPSFENQSPINIQMPMPGDIEGSDPVSLELHFLIRKEATPSHGTARVEIKSVYLDNNEQFDIFDSPQTFQFTNNSNNFSVIEPTNADSVRHLRVIIPLENINAKRGAFVLFSITRIDPTGNPIEYNGDIYLAAAAFKYTLND